MDEIVVEKLNNTYFKINCTVEQAYDLRSYFECHADKYWFHPKFKAGMWNGIISYYNVYDQTLPIGLFGYFKNFVKKYGYSYVLAFDKNEFVNDIEREDLHDFYKIIFKESDYYPRDYQDEAIFRLLKKKRGVVESPTSSGKSMVIYALIKYIMKTTDKKILLVVPNVGLTNQMFDDFYDYGWTELADYVSVLFHGSKKYDKDKRILISTWQSIHNKRESFFNDYGAVICDEVHMCGTSQCLQKIFKNCTNAEYRIGVTGTMPEVPVDVFNIYGFIGPKLLEIETRTLQDLGHMAKIKIANLLLKYEKNESDMIKGLCYHDEYKFIISHSTRNKVFKFIIDNINKKDNVLILCQYLDHIQSVYEYVNEIYGKERIIYKIDGAVKGEKREEIRKNINIQEGVILVASFGTMSTGINIPKLHHVVLGSSYKSKIKVLQSIGRGLRNHKSKKKLIVWDLVDDLRYKNSKGDIKDNTLFKHFRSRLKYYKQKKFDYINKIVRLSKL